MRLLYYAMVEIELPDGHAVHTHEICENLASLGHEVILLCPRPRSAVPYAISYKIAGIPFFGYALHRKAVHFLFSFFYLLKYAIIFKPCVIIDKNTAMNPFPELVARMAGIPFVVEINGIGLDEIRGSAPAFRFIYRKLECFKLKMARIIVSVSRYLIQRHVDEYSLEAGKFRIIDNGVNALFFSSHDRTALRRRYDVPSDKFIMGYVGSFNLDHDFTTLLLTCRRLTDEKIDYHVFFVGEGTKLQETKSQAENLGIMPSLTFMGKQAYQDVPGIMQTFDAGVILMEPSRVNALSSVMKLKEYLASGLPVITNSFSDEESGLSSCVYQSGIKNPENVYASIRRIIANPEEARTMALKGREIVSGRFTWKSTARQYEDLLVQIS